MANFALMQDNIMSSIKNISAYLCKNYPHVHELSKTRLTKLVYLADWFSALDSGQQITNIKWKFDHFGPYVDEVIREAEAHPDVFVVTTTKNIYGNEKTLVSLVDNVKREDLSVSNHEKKILDKVISETKNMYWKPFLKFVYATPPIVQADRYERLDLIKVAKSERRAS